MSCVLCKEEFPDCLEFHHIDNTQKEICINDVVKTRDVGRLLREIKKCVILCANCHRKVHAGNIYLHKDLIKPNYAKLLVQIAKNAIKNSNF
jgi:predicted HNH restriction endonuclease